ncbi:hypothetical protein [Halalkalibacter oceani]|uniref:hypothetical protein n=1 Tax=Halalkalibacter oceani TaxID=1653776 RepID=UPI003392043C
MNLEKLTDTEKEVLIKILYEEIDMKREKIKEPTVRFSSRVAEEMNTRISKKIDEYELILFKLKNSLGYYDI